MSDVVVREWRRNLLAGRDKVQDLPREGRRKTPLRVMQSLVFVCCWKNTGD